MYRFFTRLRNRLYDNGSLKSFHASLPVFCVGNITAGGNGKTPLVCYLVSCLKQMGRMPVVLSRGYGGSEKGPYLIQSGDCAQLVGDEPRMMSEMLGVPVVIARKRVEGAQFVQNESLGDVIVLDDGYQHRQLARNLNIVVANIGSPSSTEAFLRGRVIPFGRFREDRDEAFKRADAIVFAHRKPQGLSQLDKRLIAVLPEGLPFYQSFIRTTGVYREDGTKVDPQEAYLFCAIAAPEVVIDTLQCEGFRVRGHRFFTDHAEYSLVRMHQILKSAGDALPVCTEKDFVKLPNELKNRVAVLKTETCLEDDEHFKQQVQSVLQRYSG